VDLSGVAVALALASVQGPAWAATRLMGLDPYRVAGCLARLGGAGGPVEEVAGRAVECTMDSLPSTSAPLLDIGAAQHSSWEVRLFAS
jgi:urease accessory protein